MKGWILWWTFFFFFLTINIKLDTFWRSKNFGNKKKFIKIIKADKKLRKELKNHNLVLPHLNIAEVQGRKNLKQWEDNHTPFNSNKVCEVNIT